MNLGNGRIKFLFSRNKSEREMFNSTSSDSSTNKKRVPDWLNSSLWSSPSPTTPPSPSPSPSLLPSDDDAAADREVKLSSPTSAKPSSQKSEAYAHESPTKAPAQVHPPVVFRAEPAKVEIKDPLSGYYSSDDENGNGHNGSTAVEAEASPALSVSSAAPAARSTNFTADDISRQAQLLQERKGT